MSKANTAENNFPHREVEDAKEVPGKAKHARKVGPHGKVTQADGSKQATPGKPHTPKDKAGSAVFDELN